MTASFEELLGPVRVVPVITIPDAESALPLARALVDGGLPLLEITLRTQFGLGAIKQIAAEVPGAVVGAGTVVTAQQYRLVREAGAQFIVSPGCSDSLAAAAEQAGGVFLPGAVTATEVIGLLDHEISMMKFFPAATSGGVAALKALAGPFPNVRFCPTGGITLASSAEYLALKNVACVGGSWMVPADLVAAGQWDQIRALAAETVAATSVR